MSKCYVVMQLDGGAMHPLSVFANEGEAQKSADAHFDLNRRTWVEEVNYYA